MNRSQLLQKRIVAGGFQLNRPFRIVSRYRYIFRILDKKNTIPFFPIFCSHYATKPEKSIEAQNNETERNRTTLAVLRKTWGASGNPIFDVSKMRHLLDHDNHEMRDKFREFMTKPLFQPRFDLTLGKKIKKYLESIRCNFVQKVFTSSSGPPK